MSKYIDAEPYEDCRIVLHKEDPGVKVKDIHTADVEEVRHGKWKSSYSRRGDFTNRFYICSCCDEWFDKDFAQIVTHNVGNKKCGFNYCPNCGAKMYGGKT